jgi:hypothetical protein
VQVDPVEQRSADAGAAALWPVAGGEREDMTLRLVFCPFGTVATSGWAKNKCPNSRLRRPPISRWNPSAERPPAMRRVLRARGRLLVGGKDSRPLRRG